MTTADGWTASGDRTLEEGPKWAATLQKIPPNTRHPDPKDTMGKGQLVLRLSPIQNPNSSSWVAGNVGPLPRLHSGSVPKGFLCHLESHSYVAGLLVRASGARNRGETVWRHF